MKSLLCAAGLCMSLLGCAGSLAPSPPAPRLALSLTRMNGETFALEAAPPRPRLLFLFATYDNGSQFALVPVSRFAESEPRVQVLGIALQPGAQKLLPLFARSLSLPFELLYDPNNQLLQGQTALGEVAGVPALVALDVEGRIRGTHYGIPTAEDLRTLAKDALR